MPETKKRTSFTAETREYISMMAKALTPGRDWWERSQDQRELQKLMCGCRVPEAEIQTLAEQLRDDPAIAAVEEQIRVLTAQLTELRRPIYERMEQLREQVSEIDRVDHPKAERLYEESKAWRRYWVVEKVVAGEPLDVTTVRKQFLTEVAQGWRPSAPAELTA